VARGQVGTNAATHASAATLSALANDWYASFSNVPAGAQGFRLTYKGKNCSGTTGTACVSLAAPIPQQTVKICDWTISGAPGCATPTSNGWVTLLGPPAQPQAVGSAADVTSSWSLAGAANHYIGTGSYKGQVRVLIHTDRWTSPSPNTFSTWGNLMKLVYDAP
jgi:hypothetical protein